MPLESQHGIKAIRHFKDIEAVQNLTETVVVKHLTGIDDNKIFGYY